MPMQIIGKVSNIVYSYLGAGKFDEAAREIRKMPDKDDRIANKKIFGEYCTYGKKDYFGYFPEDRKNGNGDTPKNGGFDYRLLDSQNQTNGINQYSPKHSGNNGQNQNGDFKNKIVMQDQFYYDDENRNDGIKQKRPRHEPTEKEWEMIDHLRDIILEYHYPRFYNIETIMNYYKDIANLCSSEAIDIATEMVWNHVSSDKIFPYAIKDLNKDNGDIEHDKLEEFLGMFALVENGIPARLKPSLYNREKLLGCLEDESARYIQELDAIQGPHIKYRDAFLADVDAYYAAKELLKQMDKNRVNSKQLPGDAKEQHFYWADGAKEFYHIHKWDFDPRAKYMSKMNKLLKPSHDKVQKRVEKTLYDWCYGTFKEDIYDWYTINSLVYRMDFIRCLAPNLYKENRESIEKEFADHFFKEILNYFREGMARQSDSWGNVYYFKDAMRIVWNRGEKNALAGDQSSDNNKQTKKFFEKPLLPSWIVKEGRRVAGQEAYDMLMKSVDPNISFHMYDLEWLVSIVGDFLPDKFYEARQAFEKYSGYPYESTYEFFIKTFEAYWNQFRASDAYDWSYDKDEFKNYAYTQWFDHNDRSNPFKPFMDSTKKKAGGHYSETTNSGTADQESTNSQHTNKTQEHAETIRDNGNFNFNIDECYTILGVERDATKDQVKNAYRRKVKEAHPDMFDNAHGKDRDDYDDVKQFYQATEDERQKFSKEFRKLTFAYDRLMNFLD